mmetsp:Transcript_31107/g.93253  ORF Transcript_31107/g.93253 Transcript_31107/m.93253 type:complete len:436 (-) Transcript_31107:337-1644(-)
MKPVSSFSSPMGEIENTFIQSLGISMAEVVQRLVTDEVLHEIDARHIHRLLADSNVSARDVVMRLEQNGGSSSRKAVNDFRRSVIRLFQQQLPQHVRPRLNKRIQEKRENDSQQVRLPVVNRNEHFVPRDDSDSHPSDCCASESARFLYTAFRPDAAVPVIENVCNHLAQRVAELDATEDCRPKVVLVGRGKYNPIHKIHLRHFVIARQYLEERTRFSVLGGLLVPKHATEVRQRCRTRPQEIITPRHRLAMVRVAVGGSPWLTVDSWEITRRRILDYLSTLDHIRQLFEQRFPGLNAPVRFVLLVTPDELLRLNLGELKDAGHECITVCRPQEHERLLRQMGTRWRNIAHVVEDNALLSADLESTSSGKLRHALISGKLNTVASKLPGVVLSYIKHHQLAEKMSGKVSWTRWDKAFADGEVCAGLIFFNLTPLG